MLQRLEIVPFAPCQRLPGESAIATTRHLPEKAISGRTRRSRLSNSRGSALLRTESARFRLFETSPTFGANCRHPIRGIATVLMRRGTAVADDEKDSVICLWVVCSRSGASVEERPELKLA